MQFDANIAPARANPVSGQAGSSIAGEIDLYDELLVFAEMSTEEQRLYLTDTNSDTTSVNEAPQAPQLSGPEPAAPEAVDKVDPANTGSTADSLVVLADSTPLDVKLDYEIEVTEAVVELVDASDPLVDLNLDGAVIGVPPGKDCLGCGAESGADDLFCMSCGSFLNGVASNSPSNPICADCSQSISVDEIFCPWCGSVLAGN